VKHRAKATWDARREANGSVKPHPQTGRYGGAGEA
jgi:hypothetical protein